MRNERHKKAHVERVVSDHPTQRATANSKAALRPLSAIACLFNEGLISLSTDQISSDSVGWKAYGLASLPPEWVPHFLVVNAECLDGNQSDRSLQEAITASLQIAQIRTSRVYVRSSGTQETMQHRGRLFSADCSLNDVVSTVRELMKRLTTQTLGRVHWIVQEYVEPSKKGHLSNERHLSKEQRDFVAEIERRDDHPGYTASVAIRRWRDGNVLADFSLACESEPQITLRLKRVAMWAEKLASRVHFEWVWDGHAISIVQADSEDSGKGANPSTLLPANVASIALQSLRLFRPATAQDYDRYNKLRNARLYRELGYKMPPFYVLNDQPAIENILTGTISSDIENDLSELTKRPLIIRTDGENVPSDKREMLPRSDELRTFADAKKWLTKRFKSKIEQGSLQKVDLCLVAHHFIPSVSSAWARAEPGNRIVRIESLWGLPEGLYWYSHDTFEVDTQEIAIETCPPSPKYKVWDRLRYKGTFIAPDADGKWVPYRATPPYDWRRSVKNEKWLWEIAYTTRRVAEQEKFPVSVMWFIDNHPEATPHKVLPWFHVKSELSDVPKAAPRRKFTLSQDFTLRTSLDWNELKDRIGRGQTIERLVVEPSDSELIRDPRFVEDIAKFAAANNIVIELAGGILSHAYYMLQRAGAQVECTDLFGADEDVVEYNKLVRDKIPLQIEQRGERVDVLQLTGDVLVTALRQKLVEECFEALDAKAGDELIGELADVEEVIYGICHSLQVGDARIEKERNEKRKRRGGFDDGFMLRKTKTPHSITRQSATYASGSLSSSTDDQSSKPLLVEPVNLPIKPLYRRPDRRQLGHDIEKLFTFEVEVNKLDKVEETVSFSLPITTDLNRQFTLTVEFRRNRASLRGVVRLRLEPERSPADGAQLPLEFSE